jgi:hypothetical protein
MNINESLIYACKPSMNINERFIYACKPSTNINESLIYACKPSANTNGSLIYACKPSMNINERLICACKPSANTNGSLICARTPSTDAHKRRPALPAGRPCHKGGMVCYTSRTLSLPFHGQGPPGHPLRLRRSGGPPGGSKCRRHFELGSLLRKLHAAGQRAVKLHGNLRNCPAAAEKRPPGIACMEFCNNGRRPTFRGKRDRCKTPGSKCLRHFEQRRCRWSNERDGYAGTRMKSVQAGIF